MYDNLANILPVVVYWLEHTRSETEKSALSTRIYRLPLTWIDEFLGVVAVDSSAIKLCSFIGLCLPASLKAHLCGSNNNLPKPFRLPSSTYG